MPQYHHTGEFAQDLFSPDWRWSATPDLPGWAMRNRIKEFRKRAGLTLEQLAALLDTSAQQVSRLERSERRLSQEWLEKLCAALSVGPADLLGVPLGPVQGSRFVQDAEQIALLDLWDAMSPDDREALARMARALAKVSSAGKVDDDAA